MKWQRTLFFFSGLDQANTDLIGKDQIPKMERGSAQDMNRKQESFTEELANKEDVGRSLKERPAYLQKIRLLHDPNPTEEHVNSLKETIELMLIRRPQLQFFEDGIKITATDTI